MFVFYLNQRPVFQCPTSVIQNVLICFSNPLVQHIKKTLMRENSVYVETALSPPVSLSIFESF